jgi:hypothetical protein
MFRETLCRDVLYLIAAFPQLVPNAFGSLSVKLARRIQCRDLRELLEEADHLGGKILNRSEYRILLDSRRGEVQSIHGMHSNTKPEDASNFLSCQRPVYDSCTAGLQADRAK